MMEEVPLDDSVRHPLAPDDALLSVIVEEEEVTPQPAIGYGERARRFYHAFGLRFLLVTAMIEHVLQGFVFSGGGGGLVGAPIPFLFRDYGLTASRIQVLMTICVSPWAMKPLIGILSDAIYVRGYRKVPYILATTVGAIVCCLAIGLYCPESPIAICVLLFFVFMQISVADLLIEAKEAEKAKEGEEAEQAKSGREHESTLRADIVVFVHMGGYVGRFFSVALVGFLIQFVPLRYIYLIPIPFFLALLYPVAQNWIDDREWTPAPYNPQLRLRNLLGGRLGWYKKHDAPTVCERRARPLLGLDEQKVSKNSRPFLLALVVGAIALFNNAIGLLEIGTLPLMISSVVCALAMIALFFAFTDRRIARIMTFVILQNMFSFDLDTAAFFFYTDNAAQYPEGPHFSIFFYVTVMGMLSIVLGIVGTLIYFLVMCKWTYRNIFLSTGAFNVFLSAFNIIFFLRLNVQWGIPDTVFVVGTDALKIITGSLAMMPAQSMMLGLCPDGIESTVYALLAGTANLGGSLSSYQGAYLLDALSVKPSGAAGESAQFDNLWIASMIDTLVRLVPLVFLVFLIPNTPQTEKLLKDSDDTRAEADKTEAYHFVSYSVSRILDGASASSDEESASG
jgi:hypothetical protein